MDALAVIREYIDSEDEAQKLYQWALDNTNLYYLKNITNTKANIEETKFPTIYNIGIEYSKDNKYKLSYRNKSTIHINESFKDIYSKIRSVNGIDKEILRYILFGIKCLKQGIQYDINELVDYNYDKYFKVSDETYSIPCVVCKSLNTTPMMLQTRASDEDPTVRMVCKDCGKNFAPLKFKL